MRCALEINKIVFYFKIVFNILWKKFSFIRTGPRSGTQLSSPSANTIAIINAQMTTNVRANNLPIILLSLMLDLILNVRIKHLITAIPLELYDLVTANA